LKCKIIKSSCRYAYGRKTIDAHGNEKCELGATANVITVCDYECDNGEKTTKCQQGQVVRLPTDEIPFELDEGRKEVFDVVPCTGGERKNVTGICPKELWYN